MTEEEIRPIAENYVEEFCHDIHGEYEDGDLVCAGIGTALIVARKLEKQNKELKKQLDGYDLEMGLHRCHERIEELEKQIAEAKEIIKTLYGDCKSFAECEDSKQGFWEDGLAKAEAFLKESE